MLYAVCWTNAPGTRIIMTLDDTRPDITDGSAMKSQGLHSSFLRQTGLLLVASALLAVIGCDDGADSGDVFRVDPDKATLSQAEKTVSLGAVGGEDPLTWTVTDASLGSVAAQGRVVTYTRSTANGINTVQVTDSQGWLASAYITQQDDPEPTTTLVVSPTSVTLSNDGDKRVFSASGGQTPYQWKLGDSSRGKLEVDGYSQAIYTRTKAGNNTVILTDGDGHAAIADVIQPSGAKLTVTASPSSLAKNGDKSILTASGGVPPYTWSVQDVALGHLLSTTGDSVVYVRDQPGQNVVTVRDSAGAAANVIINQP